MSRDGKVELSYFGLQAHLGTTKHMGGFACTQELVKLCKIDSGSRVLEVGCGVGATTCYLAEQFGCEAVGIDLREAMIARARERAKNKGLENKVEFQVADALDLPFENDSFDVVFCESVATFIENKQQVANEFARVIRSGGIVGLNEEIWLQPPLPDMVEAVSHIWEMKPQVPTADEWRAILEHAGLGEIAIQVYEFDTRREATQTKRYSAGDMWRMTYRTAVLYLTNREFRQYLKGRRGLPKELFKYLGYALFAGRKGQAQDFL